jgi:glucose/arabinose dehydrogenase
MFDSHVFAFPAARLAAAFTAAALVLPAYAQQKADEKPAAPAAPAAPPSWQQGRSTEQEKSPLHPFAPHLTGRPVADLPVNTLKVPAGFKVEVWAEGVPEARSLALGDKGTVFVSNRNAKNVYAIVDRGGKREVKTLLIGPERAERHRFSKGTLYVAERHRITRYDGIESRLDSPPRARSSSTASIRPTSRATSGNSSRWGPTASSTSTSARPAISSCRATCRRPSCGWILRKACSRTWPWAYATPSVSTGIPRPSSCGSPTMVATGWATIHRTTRCNRVAKLGVNFGYPFCHQGDTLDPEYGKNRSCAEFTPPALKLGAHIAPLGMRFYTGKMFPAEYQNNIFIAMHGSWNRSTKQGL